MNGVVSDANSQVISLTGAISNLTDPGIATAVAKESGAQLRQEALGSLAPSLAKKTLVNVLA